MNGWAAAACEIVSLNSFKSFSLCLITSAVISPWSNNSVWLRNQEVLRGQKGNQWGMLLKTRLVCNKPEISVSSQYEGETDNCNDRLLLHSNVLCHYGTKCWSQLDWRNIMINPVNNWPMLSCLNTENKFEISAGSEEQMESKLFSALSADGKYSQTDKMRVKAPSDRHPIMSKNLCCCQVQSSSQVPGRL